MLIKGTDTNGRGAAPPQLLSRAIARARRLTRRKILLSLAHVSLKQQRPPQAVDYLSGDADTLTEAEAADLHEHVKDGLRMFRTAARAVAPGRTVAAQIRAVAKALYGNRWLLGWRRIKACCYREAGPGIVLDVKYRFEAWTQAKRESGALAERKQLREARSDAIIPGD